MDRNKTAMRLIEDMEARETPEDEALESPEHQAMEEELGVEKHDPKAYRKAWLSGLSGHATRALGNRMKSRLAPPPAAAEEGAPADDGYGISDDEKAELLRRIGG